jgi:hypothetical protein
MNEKDGTPTRHFQGHVYVHMYVMGCFNANCLIFRFKLFKREMHFLIIAFLHRNESSANVVTCILCDTPELGHGWI